MPRGQVTQDSGLHDRLLRVPTEALVDGGQDSQKAPGGNV